MEGQRRPIWAPTLTLVQTAGGPPDRVAYVGAFRIALVGVRVVRHLDLTSGPGAPAQPTIRVDARFEARAEPRLNLLSAEAPRLLEALDDRGQSFLPDPPPAPSPAPEGRRPEAGRGPVVAFELPLQPPERPGQTLRRLRGTFSALVVGTRREPMTIRVDGPPGRTGHLEGDALTIQEVGEAEDGRGGTTIVLFPSVAGPIDRSSRLPRRANGPQAPSGALPRLDFVDAEGRLLLSRTISPHELEKPLKVTVPPAKGVGPPAVVRYKPPIWATVEVPFAFEDVPLP